MRFFVNQFTTVGNARKGRFFIDVVFPLVAGLVTIYIAFRAIDWKMIVALLAKKS